MSELTATNTSSTTLTPRDFLNGYSDLSSPETLNALSTGVASIAPDANFLTFKQGVWRVYGSDSVIQKNVLFVASPSSFGMVHQLWVGGKVLEQNVYRLTEGTPPKNPQTHLEYPINPSGEDKVDCWTTGCTMDLLDRYGKKYSLNITSLTGAGALAKFFDAVVQELVIKCATTATEGTSSMWMPLINLSFEPATSANGKKYYKPVFCIVDWHEVKN